MSYQDPFVVEPRPEHPHTHTILLLHGRSSTAEDFANDLFSLKSSNPPLNLLSIFPGFRWVFLNAGKRWCTPFKEERSAWCDTFSLTDLSERQDLQVAGLRDGVRLVKRTIEEEADRLEGDSSRIILGGFSQGAATALWSLFTGATATRGRLGAFIGLSAWMPFVHEAKASVHVGALGGLPFQASRVEGLAKSFLDILGVEPFVTVEASQQCILTTPVYLGHGTDVREHSRP